MAPGLRSEIAPAAGRIVQRMAELAVSGRNGIWAFVLRNTYRPALLAGEFNGVVCNPPWLAMSSIGDNPYTEMLTRRAEVYGVRPTGESFLHLELATIHLLHAVDRYLAVGAVVACLVPQSVLNGKHQERFRRREFLNGPRAVPLMIDEVWEVADGTFKIPGAVLVGRKHSSISACFGAPAGAMALESGQVERQLSVALGGAGRNAWIIREPGQGPARRVTDVSNRKPQQGADLMPRTAVCVETTSDHESERRVDTPSEESQWGFTVTKAKKLAGASFPGHVAHGFIYHMAQSENLLPFLLGRHRAPIAIPAMRDSRGKWAIYENSEIRRLGFNHTARRFERINAALGNRQHDTLQYRINVRNKLVKQRFPSEGYIFLSGAGGKRICAAAVHVHEAKDLVIDQTLYWTAIRDRRETWYWVGVFNSQAMTDAVLPLNPKGALGERHIHTLPYTHIPVFDNNDERHNKIADLAQEVAQDARRIVDGDDYLDDPTRSLQHRRRKLHARLASGREMRLLQQLCVSLLRQ